MNSEQIERQKQEVHGYTVGRNFVFGMESFYGTVSILSSLSIVEKNDSNTLTFATTALFLTAGVSYWRRQIDKKLDDAKERLQRYYKIQ